MSRYRANARIVYVARPGRATAWIVYRDAVLASLILAGMLAALTAFLLPRSLLDSSAWLLAVPLVIVLFTPMVIRVRIDASGTHVTRWWGLLPRRTSADLAVPIYVAERRPSDDFAARDLYVACAQAQISVDDAAGLAAWLDARRRELLAARDSHAGSRR